MKLIKPSVEFYETVPTDYESAIKFIELAGRTCYKSEDKITEESAEKFVKKLIKAGHLAMVEHSNFVAVFDSPYVIVIHCLGKYLNTVIKNGKTYVGGSLTAWYQQSVACEFYAPLFMPFINTYGELFKISIENQALATWQVCPHDEIPKELHRYAAKFICDRGVSHELVRHRPAAMDWFGEFVDSPIYIYKVFDGSLAQESTRYVNYGNKDMEFIEPVGFDEWESDAYNQFMWCCKDEEWRYNRMLNAGLSPQQARAILPNALKTEIVVTADAAEWQHIRTLRTAAAAHPDMRRVMNMMPWNDFL